MVCEDELKKIFIEFLNSCYPVVSWKHPHMIFWYYDEQIVRRIKLNKISNINNTGVSYNYKVKGTCLFMQDIRRQELSMSIDILDFFELNYSYKKCDILDLVASWIPDIKKKIQVEYIRDFFPIYEYYLKDEKSLKIYSTYVDLYKIYF